MKEDKELGHENEEKEDHRITWTTGDRTPNLHVARLTLF